MNRDDIIQMAHETDCLDEQHYGSVWANKLERFAALVAAAEREACARLLERDIDMQGLIHDPVWAKFTVDLLINCAKLIRARGEQ
jgi:hypothetical protein